MHAYGAAQQPTALFCLSLAVSPGCAECSKTYNGRCSLACQAAASWRSVAWSSGRGMDAGSPLPTPWSPLTKLDTTCDNPSHRVTPSLLLAGRDIQACIAIQMPLPRTLGPCSWLVATAQTMVSSLFQTLLFYRAGASKRESSTGVCRRVITCKALYKVPELLHAPRSHSGCAVQVLLTAKAMIQLASCLARYTSMLPVACFEQQRPTSCLPN